MDKIKSIGTFSLGIMVVAALLIVPFAFIYGIPWISAKILPAIAWVTNGAILVSVVSLPFAFARRARPTVSLILVISSFIFGFHLWLFSALVSFSIWGYTGLIIGLLLAGIGVLFIAVLACLFNGMWTVLGALVGSAVMVYGARLLGYYIAAKADADTGSEHYVPQATSTYPADPA
jgi:hypothetical protein